MGGWLGEFRGKRREREREGEGRMDRTSRLKERLGYERIRDSAADIRATDIRR